MRSANIRRDVKWASDKGLQPSITGAILKIFGPVSFRAHYNGINLLYDLDIPRTVNSNKIIEDCWMIDFEYDYGENTGIPIVYDVSGRIQITMTRTGNSLLDMHLNAGGAMPAKSFCVAPRLKLQNEYASGFNLEHYRMQYLIPFLFQQSYFERNDGNWPWKNYPHGPAGDEQYLAEMALSSKSH